MNQIQAELRNPKDYLPESKFLKQNKFAVVVYSDTYSEKVNGMINLPEVNDDYKNTMQLVHLMGIPQQNIFVLKNTTFDEIDALYKKLTLIIIAQTKELVNSTGVFCGDNDWLTHGIPWSRIKINFMKDGASPDYIEVS